MRTGTQLITLRGHAVRVLSVAFSPDGRTLATASRDNVVNLALTSAEKLVNQKLDDDTHRRLIREYIDELGEMPNA